MNIMNIRKNYRIFYSVILMLFMIYANTSNAQTVEFSKQVAAFKEDANIQIIANMWAEYMKDKSGAAKSKYWVGKDYIEYEAPGSRFYNYNLQHVYNISKINDTTYEINTIAYMLVNPDNYYELVSAIYKVYAININGQWKLSSFLDMHMDEMEQYKAGHINYIYPPGYDFSRKEARNTGKFINEFVKLYEIAPVDEITYAVSNSLDQSSHMVGFSYTLYRSESKYAGRFIYPSTILSARCNHIHEIVHALIIPQYPDCHYMLNEGIATFYGGHANVPYEDLYKLAQDWLKQNDCNFEDFESLYAIEVDGIHPFENILGARIIEYTINKYGHSKIKDLLTIKDYKEIFEAIDVTDINRFCKGLFSN